jgi:hypothetical protein
MNTFADRNTPGSRPVGEVIPGPLRRVILEIVRAHAHVDDAYIWLVLRRYYGWSGDYIDAYEYIGDRFGQAERVALERVHASARNYRNGTTDLDSGLLENVHVALFLSAIELVIDNRLSFPERQLVLAELNRLFSIRGVAFTFDVVGKADWVGDRGAHDVVVRPALDMLSGARLAGARSEFEAALGHLRSGSPKDNEDAIDEAAKSVESAMKVIAAERRTPLPGGQTAFALFGALKDAGVVIAEADHAVLGAARLRNNRAAHGAGAQPRAVSNEEAGLALRAAAAALVYLATKLPG